MSSERKIVFDFGEVLFRKNPRTRSIRIKVHPENGVVVSMPGSCREDRAINFVIEKELWIRKSMARMAKKKQQITVFSDTTPFKTYAHTLRLLHHAKPTLRMELKGKMLIIYYPENVDYRHERVQEFARNSVLKTLRLEAKNYLPLRTRELAAKHNFQVGNITVRNNKTRWGSCSGKNNISLNIHLMRLNDDLIDYVIMHELTHTRVKNHSRHFWSELEKAMPGAGALDKELNKHHLVYW